jgi:hypothetical protein
MRKIKNRYYEERQLPLKFKIKFALLDYFSNYTFNWGDVDGVSIIIGIIFFPVFVIFEIVKFIFEKIIFPIILFIPNQIAKWISV